MSDYGSADDDELRRLLEKGRAKERQELPASIRRLVDEPYLAWVRTLPCRARDMGGQCMGDVVPHHRVGGGMGTKTGDRQTIPLCHYHHRARHDLNGPFKGWSRDRIREWERVEVLATLAMRLGFDGDDVF